MSYKFSFSPLRGSKRKFYGMTACVYAFLLFLAACGFHPVYGSHNGSGGDVAGDLNLIAIDNIPNRQGQILRNDLIDRMYAKGRPQQPSYTLTVKLDTSEQDLGIQADATSSRSLMNVTANYTLKDMKGKEILRGTAHSAASYNKISDQYATLAAHDSTVERTANEVSEQIVNRLSLYFSEHPAGEVIVNPSSPSPPPAPVPVPVFPTSGAGMP